VYIGNYFLLRKLLLSCASVTSAVIAATKRTCVRAYKGAGECEGGYQGAGKGLGFRSGCEHHGCLGRHRRRNLGLSLWVKLVPSSPNAGASTTGARARALFLSSLSLALPTPHGDLTFLQLFVCVYANIASCVRERVRDSEQVSERVSGRVPDGFVEDGVSERAGE
jgi:hypothetical protein